jgi:hypothetical protein
MLEPAALSFGRILDVGAAIFGFATWIVPVVMLAVTWKQRPRSSLAGVGFAISIFVVAACLSAIGLLLALLTLAFAQNASWASLALVAIAAFWLSGAVFIYVAHRRRRLGDVPSRSDRARGES